MKKSLVLLSVLGVATLLVLSVSLMSSGKTKGNSKELAQGTYATDDELSWVQLSEDNKFEFQRGVTSYRPTGNYYPGT